MLRLSRDQSWNVSIESGSGAGETAQCLRALAAHPEDLIQFPTPTWGLTAVSNSRPRESDSSSPRESDSFWPPQAPVTYAVVNRQTCRQNTCIHKIKERKGLGGGSTCL